MADIISDDEKRAREFIKDHLERTTKYGPAIVEPFIVPQYRTIVVDEENGYSIEEPVPTQKHR